MEDHLPANKGARWTAEDDARLVAAVGRAVADWPATLKELAADFGRTTGAIQGRLERLDVLVYPPYTDMLKQAARDKLLHAHDDKLLEDKEKAAPFMRPWVDEEVAALLAAHNSGEVQQVVDLAPVLGRSVRALVLKLSHLGVLEPQVNAHPEPEPLTYAKPKKVVEVRVAKPATEGGAKGIKLTVTPEFQTALASIMAGENLLILGSAGTGKSTFLKWLRQKLMGEKRYAILAPTGMAALNVGGQTIHSFFGLKPQLQVGAPLPKPRNKKVFESLDVLIIDEISMVRADVFDMMDRVLRHYGKSKKLPFGGVQVVLMGDLCQLPPVVRREEGDVFSSHYAHPFFFATEAWTRGAFHTLKFTHIFRQKEVDFIAMLNAVREGKCSPALLEMLNARQLPEGKIGKQAKGAVTLAARNHTVDAINQRELLKLKGEVFRYHADVTGDLANKEFTTPAELVLKEGARVMFTRNHKLGLWVNGSLGVVKYLTDDSIGVLLDEGTARGVGQEVVEVEREKWESVKYAHDAASNAPVATVAGTFVQFPLTLAWALTIHKAQGQTLPQCVIDLADGGTFAEGQLYVALSRARNLEGLHLTTPIRPQHIKTHPAVLAFYAALAAA
ncbi:MAG: PIF1 family ATP-dependent DNA helicase [Alphaproteobacteria bacterium]